MINIATQPVRDSAWRRRLTASLTWFLSICVAAAAQGETLDDLRLLPPLGTSVTTTDELIPPTAEADSADSIVPDGALPSTEPLIDEIIPLAEESSPWLPTKWFTGPIWEYGTELGINGSAGNATAFSILTGANAKRVTEGNVFEWNLKYGKTQNAGVQTQHFALFNSRWDKNLSPLTLLYNKNTLEYDEFKAFDIRLAVSGGFGRHLIKNDITNLTARFGAGVSREFGGPDDSYVPEANLGMDFEHKLTKRQRLKVTSDYYPSWQDFGDFRLVTDAFWEIKLEEAAGLSLKFGAIDRYDSTPNGRKPNDIDYFVTLILKR